MEKALTVEQAAEVLQVLPITVRRWLRSGRVRGVKLGRVWRVPESALHELLNPKADEAQTAKGKKER
jgi:excisionase family DNA binding protein